MNHQSLRILLHGAALGFSIFICGCAATPSGTDSIPPGAKGALRSVGGIICQDVNSGRMWQVDKKEQFTSLREAENYAESLELGGYGDWRLPARDELLTLHKIFFWRRNGDCTMKSGGEYWLKPEDGVKSPGHFETYFLCGPEFKYVESLQEEGYVRAVRP